MVQLFVVENGAERRVYFLWEFDMSNARTYTYNLVLQKHSVLMYSTEYSLLSLKLPLTKLPFPVNYRFFHCDPLWDSSPQWLGTQSWQVPWPLRDDWWQLIGSVQTFQINLAWVCLQARVICQQSQICKAVDWLPWDGWLLRKTQVGWPSRFHFGPDLLAW